MGMATEQLEHKIAAILQSGITDHTGLLKLFLAGSFEPPEYELELAFLEAVADYVPFLQKAAIDSANIGWFIYKGQQIAMDGRSAVGGTYEVRKKYAKDYLTMLALDAVILHREGLNERGMDSFISYATHTCLSGQLEHDHIPEEQRERQYVSVISAIRAELKAKRQPFMKDQETQVRQMFEHAVYGDNTSGLHQMRAYTISGPQLLRALLGG